MLRNTLRSFTIISKQIKSHKYIGEFVALKKQNLKFWFLLNSEKSELTFKMLLIFSPKIFVIFQFESDL